jgi:aminoglycoside phosphotransferase (APT) family kinase protein
VIGIAIKATSCQATDCLSREHAYGFSSLALLAGRDLHPTVLYLLTWSCATVTTTRPDGTTSSTIVVDGWSRLPLAAASIDVVVADLDLVPNSEATRRSVATEVRRVLKSKGRCIAIITHRRRPRNLRDWSRYRLVPPMSRWHHALSGPGLSQVQAAVLQFDGPRITDVQFGSRPCRDAVAAAPGDAVALVLSPTTSVEPSIVQEISRVVAGAENRIDRIHVRKIGKTAAFLSAGHSRVVVRMPCSSVALARARRNHAALEVLRRSGGSIPMQLVPEPIGWGEVGSQSYFVETCVPGVPRRERVPRIHWDKQALELITDLHVATARSHVLSEEWFQQTVEPALSNVERCELEDEGRRAIDWLRSATREHLLGERLPIVRSHGDFTAGNCLYDSCGRLSGVVDWELSSGDALPLLDLLQCVDLPIEYTRDGRWQRAELVFDAVERTGPLFDAPEIVDYMRRLGVPKDLLRALLLLYWIDHVGARVLARRADAAWFQRRVKAPLRRVRQLAERGLSKH